MNQRIVIFLVLSIALFAPKSYAQKVSLVEFGWDYPDVSQLYSNLPAMQNSPFDGICFSLQRTVTEGFDTALRKPEYFELDKLKALKWGKYKSNLLMLRGYGRLGGSWFNDNAWKTIAANTANFSRAMSSQGIRGVIFDPEYYYEDTLYNPWMFSNSRYPGKSYAEVCAQVKKRGIQFIAALQQYDQDFSFLSIWITSLLAVQLNYTKLENTSHALLIPFFEGIFEGKKSTVKIIDGNEYGYFNGTPSQFVETKAALREVLTGLMKTPKAKAEAGKLSIAQPLYYDGLMATHTYFDKGFSRAAKWKWLQENAKFAMASTDEFVWVYSEKFNWWEGKRTDTFHNILADNKISQGTPGVLLNSRSAVRRPVPDVNVNTGKGFYYLNETKQPMNTATAAFAYRLDKTSKKLTIDFSESKLPVSVAVYLNNLLFKKIESVTNKQVITLKNFSRGRLVIVAKYNDKTEASAIEIYQ